MGNFSTMLSLSALSLSQATTYYNESCVIFLIGVDISLITFKPYNWAAFCYLLQLWSLWQTPLLIGRF